MFSNNGRRIILNAVITQEITMKKHILALVNSQLIFLAFSNRFKFQLFKMLFGSLVGQIIDAEDQKCLVEEIS